uniref:Uncharacterized protein n=1 Tax=Cacopsylla melanoneura TaxID=428564 RepID=A0A8D8ZPA0_9HEMI
MNQILLTLSVLVLLWQKSFQCYGEPNTLSHNVSDQGMNINVQFDHVSNNISTVLQHGLQGYENISIHITNIFFKLPAEAEHSSKSNDSTHDLNKDTEEKKSPEKNHHKKVDKKEEHSKEKLNKDSTESETTTAKMKTTTKKKRTPKTTTESPRQTVKDNDTKKKNGNSLIILSNSVNGAPPDVKVFASNGTVFSVNATVLPPNFTVLPPNFSPLSVLSPNFTALPPNFVENLESNIL